MIWVIHLLQKQRYQWIVSWDPKPETFPYFLWKQSSIFRVERNHSFFNSTKSWKWRIAMPISERTSEEWITSAINYSPTSIVFKNQYKWVNNSVKIFTEGRVSHFNSEDILFKVLGAREHTMFEESLQNAPHILPLIQCSLISHRR